MAQENTYKIIRNVIWGAVVVTSVTVYNGFNYLSQKSATQPQRIQAVRELMESQGYQDYLQQRRELTEKIMGDSTTKNLMYIEGIVNTAFGKFNPKELTQESVFR